MTKWIIEIKYESDDPHTAAALPEIIESIAPYMVDNVSIIWEMMMPEREQ